MEKYFFYKTGFDILEHKFYGFCTDTLAGMVFIVFRFDFHLHGSSLKRMSLIF